jgi:class 3 adenylate cyclase
LHSRNFNYLGSHTTLRDFANYSAVEGIYTGATIDEEYCPMHISFYPSEKMKSQYLTSTPSFAAVGAVFIFIFTSFVFILYDWTVERRQKMVMTSAEQSNAVLSTLFPTKVKQQVLDAETKDSKKTDAPTSEIEIRVSKPIADLYPDSTVLFCDIAGFTRWSSTRDPWQVFTLLETLYGEFDKIAKDRGVFKVETIGDSYVAVTGIPKPRKNHAVVMVRFARDILSRMKQVTVKLSTVIGADTDSLDLRVGLNSGATTAGVLRGDKSRFQLFGDTVNTASRMESLGVPGRIQCSQSTADLLVEEGKDAWLIEREDLINVKGKGLMQSYWITLSSGSNASGEIVVETENAS